MDQPDCSTTMLHRTYRVFGPLNRVLAGWGRIVNRMVQQKKSASTSILDVGCGGGDVAAFVAEKINRKGISVSVTAIDTDVRAIRFCAENRPSAIRFENLSLSEMLKNGESFDYLISNHVLHHIPDKEIPGFLEECAAAGRTVIHNDIRRSIFGLLLYPIVAVIPGLFSFVLYDGMVSILKSRTVGEMQRLCGPGWQVKRYFPFRMLVFRNL